MIEFLIEQSQHFFQWVSSHMMFANQNTNQLATYFIFLFIGVFFLQIFAEVLKKQFKKRKHIRSKLKAIEIEYDSLHPEQSTESKEDYMLTIFHNKKRIRPESFYDEVYDMVSNEKPHVIRDVLVIFITTWVASFTIFSMIDLSIESVFFSYGFFPYLYAILLLLAIWQTKWLFLKLLLIGIGIWMFIQANHFLLFFFITNMSINQIKRLLQQEKNKSKDI